MIKFLKRLVIRSFTTKDLEPSSVEYDDVLTTIFNDVEITTEFYNIVLIHVVTLQFEPDITNLMLVFKKFELTIIESQVVNFKIGALCQMFLEQPMLAYKEALKISDVFTADSIKSMKKALKSLQRDEELNIIEGYKDIKKAHSNSVVAVKTEDEIANDKIDAYIKNKNK